MNPVTRADPVVLSHMGWKYARDAMFVTDCLTGELENVNPAAESLTGYSRSELIGKSFSFLHPEDERESLDAAFQKAVSGSGLIAGVHLLRKDGSTFHVEISTSAPFEIDGRMLVFGIFHDTSEMDDREHRLATKRWALRAYAGAAMALVRAESSATLMQEICEAITDEAVFVLAWIGFAEDAPGKPVRVAGAAGSALSYLDGLEVGWDEDAASGRGPTGIAIRTGAVQIVKDTETDVAFRPWLEKARQSGIRSAFAVPFRVEDGRRGAMLVYSSHPHAFGPIVSEAFTHLAEEIGVGLRTIEQAEQLKDEIRERDRAQKELSTVFSEMIRAILRAMEMRDPYTAGHQSRVADLCTAIAKAMDWPEERIEALSMAAMVHDIGKIAIPVEILTKPTQFSNPEWLMVQQHPQTGYEILKDVPFRWPIAEVVRQHHERLDGSGYPRGLKGDEIIPGARILAVADVVESMISDRPYRAALGMDIALEEILSQSGTLLDPEVVRICVDLFLKTEYKIPPRHYR